MGILEQFKYIMTSFMFSLENDGVVWGKLSAAAQCYGQVI